MATISASTGQILGEDGNPAVGGGVQNPYTIFANNLTGMLQDAQKTANQGNAALQAQVGGLQRGQAALGQPGPNNPLAFMYNMASPSALSQEQGQMSKIFEPGITSIQGQEQLANENLTNINTTANTTLNAYDKMRPQWQLSTVPDENGDWYYYNTNVGPGQPPQQYVAGKIPPGVGGSPGGSPSSSDSVGTLSQSHNPYGIKMTSTTTDMFSGLGATPGPGAVDGGNFWSFPDDTTGEKAARTLFTSSLYANDSVDQALRQWSNYTGTGKYPGYNGDILKGTGIDPNSTVKSLSANQVDVVMTAMKKAEAVPVANSTGSSDNSTVGKIAAQIAAGTLTYDQGVSQIKDAYGSAGGYMVPRLLPAIQAINPKFDPNQSNAQGAAKVSNVTNAGQTTALIEKTNGTLEMLPDAFKGIGFGESLGGGIAAFTRGLSEVTGLNKSGTDAYTSLLQEARAGLQAVLNSAAGLGVVTGGVTANSLLPDNMSWAGLQKQLGIAKKLMENTKTALANLANANAGSTESVPTAGQTTGTTPSGVKYTITP